MAGDTLTAVVVAAPAAEEVTPVVVVVAGTPAGEATEAADIAKQVVVSSWQSKKNQSEVNKTEARRGVLNGTPFLFLRFMWGQPRS